MEIFLIQIYVLPNKNCPFVKWYEELNRSMQLKIDIKLNRVRAGN